MLADVQRAYAVPFGGICIEIGLGQRGAAGSDLVRALAVAEDLRIVRGDHGEGAVDEFADARFGRAPDENPAPLLVALDQARLGQEPDMAADARLALSKKLGKVFHVELAIEKQAQDSKPGRFRRRLQTRYRVVKASHKTPL